MPHTARVPTNIQPGFDYLPHSHHRNGMAGKSQWSIAINEEVECFRDAVHGQWFFQGDGWGLHRILGQAAHLGVAKDRRTKLFLAKFVNKTSQTVWHGYPADHQNNQQDIPAVEVQRIWLESQILPPPKIRKIARGQPCSL
ncbi:MAG: hypothetical protein JST04_12860 [Bdellovibrionales bacterium]|nr:hypothetical protein [Bdellovibrionales bacterium]